jgi:hypothetical protein
VSPQARGRELAREGTQLSREHGSVKAAAAELMHRHESIRSVQPSRPARPLIMKNEIEIISDPRHRDHHPSRT